MAILLRHLMRTRRTRNATTAALVVFLFSMAGFTGSTTATEPTDPWNLDRFFTEYEITTLDALALDAQLLTGITNLDLLGQTYTLEVQPVPWLAHLDEINLEGDGSITPRAWKTTAYNGHVAGEQDSKVLLVLTEHGVGGYIQNEEGRLEIEPLALLSEGAPISSSVVYDRSNHIEPVGIAHGDLMGQPEANATAAPELPTVELSAPVSHTAPDRDMTLWYDYAMFGVSGYLSRITLAWNTLNSEYNSEFGWSFDLVNNAVYGCQTTSCDSSWGMNQDDTDQLIDWATNVKGYSTVSGFEIAALFTGRIITDNSGTQIYGSAWQPGRYGRTRGGTPMTQTMMSSTFGHEVGHNFAGDHSGSPSCPSAGSGTGTYGRARCTDHWHDTGSGYHCHAPNSLANLVWDTMYKQVGTCIGGSLHWHTSGYYHKHYTLMWGGKSSVRAYEFSSQNDNYVRNCAGHAWSGGSKTPGSTSGFGSWCTS